MLPVSNQRAGERGEEGVVLDRLKCGHWVQQAVANMVEPHKPKYKLRDKRATMHCQRTEQGGAEPTQPFVSTLLQPTSPYRLTAGEVSELKR